MEMLVAENEVEMNADYGAINKVIVTGANGFIGKSLINELCNRNIEVVAVVKWTPSQGQFFS